jgi:alkanesulfonate monooxygenase SsuD/methylene tetrahydromethanopterin reductase-like flavin-dependent oxidoreductase (luciferase family)
LTGVTPRLGVALGTIGLSASEWFDCAGELAQLPIERVWIWDHLMGRGAAERPVLEALSLAAAALARYESLAVGTLVLDVTKRHPALAAKSIATIASLAEGRLAVGLGAGGDAAEHQALGMEFGAAEERLTLMEETIGIFRALLEGDPAQRVTRPSQGAAPSLLEAASAPRPACQSLCMLREITSAALILQRELGMAGLHQRRALRKGSRGSGARLNARGGLVSLRSHCKSSVKASR